MHWYHLTLLIAFALVAWAAWDLKRGRLWVLLLASTAYASLIYLKLDLPKPWPPAECFALMCDAVAFIVIKECRKRLWEIRVLGAIVFAMASLEMAQMFAVLTPLYEPLPPHIYGGLLEGLYYLALATIGGRGLMQRLGYDRSILAPGRISALSFLGRILLRESPAPENLRRW
jgi:hypothetical protein